MTALRIITHLLLTSAHGSNWRSLASRARFSASVCAHGRAPRNITRSTPRAISRLIAAYGRLTSRNWTYGMSAAGPDEDVRQPAGERGDRPAVGADRHAQQVRFGVVVQAPADDQHEAAQDQHRRDDRQHGDHREREQRHRQPQGPGPAFGEADEINRQEVEQPAAADHVDQDPGADDHRENVQLPRQDVRHVPVLQQRRPAEPLHVEGQQHQDQGSAERRHGLVQLVDRHAHVRQRHAQGEDRHHPPGLRPVVHARVEGDVAAGGEENGERRHGGRGRRERCGDARRRHATGDRPR